MDELQTMETRTDYRALLWVRKLHLVQEIARLGMVYADVNDIGERWRERFSNLLNQQGSVDQAAGERLSTRPHGKEFNELVTIPVLDEVLKIPEIAKHPAVVAFHWMC